MIALVPFVPTHFDVLSSWFTSEADVVQWGGQDVSFPLRDEDFRAMLAEAASEPPTRRCWIAEEDGALIGHAQLALDWRHGNARLARVVIAPEARSRGLAAPMLRLVIEEAFADAAFQRLELNVYTRNEAAIRAYRQLGFVSEGVRRSSTQVGDERWDTEIMALPRDEWSAS